MLPFGLGYHMQGMAHICTTKPGTLWLLYCAAVMGCKYYETLCF